MNNEAGLYGALNRLTKWRTIFAGWQLGTRPKGDPEFDAVRDHREVTILLRAEVNALVAVLDRTLPGFASEFKQTLCDEAERLSKLYEGKFPGMQATAAGIAMDGRAVETMKGWRP